MSKSKLTKLERFNAKANEASTKLHSVLVHMWKLYRHEPKKTWERVLRSIASNINGIKFVEVPRYQKGIVFQVKGAEECRLCMTVNSTGTRVTY